MTCCIKSMKCTFYENVFVKNASKTQKLNDFFKIQEAYFSDKTKIENPNRL